MALADSIDWPWSMPESFASRFLKASSIPLLVLIYLLLKFIYAAHLYPRYFTPIKHIPYAKPSDFGKEGGRLSTSRRQIAQLYEASITVPNNGLLRYYRPDRLERVAVTSAQALNEILVLQASIFVKPEILRRRLRPVGGDGLLLAEGEMHKVQRKGLMPAFSFRHIKDLYPVFWSKSRDLVRMLEEEITRKEGPESNVVIMQSWATRTTLDIIGVAGMDHDFKSLEDPENPLTWHYNQMRLTPSRSEQIAGLILSLISANYEAILMKLPTKRIKQVKAGSSYVRKVCRELIEEKRNKMYNSKSETGVDIISVALQSSAFTNENLVDQMMTFLAAGHGTTSHALQWSVYALCKHPNIQARLRQEIRDNLPSISDSQSTVSASDIDSLPYLHAFCNEVLRFYPSISATSREASQDTTIAGYHIPKGTQFVFPIELVNHSPDLWGPTASEFDPERWMGEGKANSGGVQNHMGFLTFLQGPRSCIGSNFAKAELACLVAALVGKFQMVLQNPNGKIELNTHGIGSAPRDGVPTRLTVIDGW